MILLVRISSVWFCIHYSSKTQVIHVSVQLYTYPLKSLRQLELNILKKRTKFFKIIHLSIYLFLISYELLSVQEQVSVIPSKYNIILWLYFQKKRTPLVLKALYSGTVLKIKDQSYLLYKIVCQSHQFVIIECFHFESNVTCDVMLFKSVIQ